MDVQMTPEELEQIAETEREEQSKFAHSIKVCVAAGCVSCQSLGVKEAIDEEIKKQGQRTAAKTKAWAGWDYARKVRWSRPIMACSTSGSRQLMRQRWSPV